MTKDIEPIEASTAALPSDGGLPGPDLPPSIGDAIREGQRALRSEEIAHGAAATLSDSLVRLERAADAPASEDMPDMPSADLAAGRADPARPNLIET